MEQKHKGCQYYCQMIMRPMEGLSLHPELYTKEVNINLCLPLKYSGMVTFINSDRSLFW